MGVTSMKISIPTPMPSMATDLSTKLTRIAKYLLFFRLSIIMRLDMVALLGIVHFSAEIMFSSERILLALVVSLPLLIFAMTAMVL